MTLTFDNPVRHVTITLSDKKDAAQTPTTDQPNRQDYPKDEASIQEIDLEQNGKPMDSNLSEDMRSDNLQGHDHVDEGLPFFENVGDEIDQILYESASVVIEEEIDTTPAPTTENGKNSA